MNKRHRYSTRGHLIQKGILLIVLVGGMIALFSTNYLKRALQDRIISAYSFNVSYQVLQFERFEAEIRQYARVMVSSDELQNLIRDDEDGYSLVLKKYKMERLLSKYVSWYGNLVSIEVETPDGFVFTSESFRKMYRKDGEQEEKQEGFSEVHTIWSTESGEEEDVVSYSFPFYSFDGQEKYLLCMYIKAEAMRNVIDGEQENWQNINWIILMDGEDVLYPAMDKLTVETATLEKVRKLSRDGESLYKQGREYILFETINNSEKILIMSVTDQDMREEFQRAYAVYALILLLAMVLGVMLILAFSKRFTKPILELTSAAQRISDGERSVQVTVTENQEIAFLQTVFNQMSKEIEYQMVEIVQAEKEHNRLHNEILISQINPHFIYNTLNDAIYLIGAGENDDATRMLRSFISLLQRNLKAGVDGVIATIADEMTSIGYYCDIQQIRYPERFEIRMECEECLKERNIPRMLLQPLVENALYHGLLPKLEKGMISVKIQKKEEWMLFRIEDNGVGIDAYALQKIGQMEVRKKTSQMYSIGLANVRERLKMIYGERYKMQIKSLPKEGTVVELELPLHFE